MAHRILADGRLPKDRRMTEPFSLFLFSTDPGQIERCVSAGVAGIIVGGIVGREAGQIAEADRRQRAALHAANAFGLVALDGYGRRVIAAPMPTRSSPEWRVRRSSTPTRWPATSRPSSCTTTTSSCCGLFQPLRGVRTRRGLRRRLCVSGRE